MRVRVEEVSIVIDTIPPVSVPVKKAEAVVEQVVEVKDTKRQAERTQSGAPSWVK